MSEQQRLNEIKRQFREKKDGARGEVLDKHLKEIAEEFGATAMKEICESDEIQMIFFSYGVQDSQLPTDLDSFVTGIPQWKNNGEQMKLEIYEKMIEEA